MIRFTDTWAEARDAFRAAFAAHPHAAAEGADAIEIQPGYTLDYGWTGDPDAPRVLVYSSGLHGIEGYAGNAVQRALLARGEDTAVLWLHSLNPWGMAHDRRVNEGNVDLNRNFMADDARYEADDSAYAALAPLLNPTRIGVVDWFYPQAGWLLARHGLASLRNVIARGQYSVPEGIFFGGQERQATTRAVLEQLVPQLVGKERVVWIDLHTGRGKPGEVVAFVDHLPPSRAPEAAKQAFGDILHAWEPGSELGYEMRGGMLPEVSRRIGLDAAHSLTVEFGTASDIAILRAMRKENHLFHHGPEGLKGGQVPPSHPTRKAMRAVFNPQTESWRQAVLGHAPRVHEAALALLQG